MGEKNKIKVENLGSKKNREEIKETDISELN